CLKVNQFFSNTFCLFSLRKKSFAGEIVLITGSANGIGKQVALKLAPLGVTLVLWDIDDEGNKETSRLAQQKGAGRVFVYHCDCSNRQDVYEQADKVRKEVGDVTILINNAGILTGKKFCDLTDEDFEKTFRINFFSQVWTCKAFLPAMVACNRGHLVSTASTAGILGFYRMSDYSASKSAIIGMMEAINSELYHAGKRGIKTTIVCPYFISTRLSRGFRRNLIGEWALLMFCAPRNLGSVITVRAVRYPCMTCPYSLCPTVCTGTYCASDDNGCGDGIWWVALWLQ
uniref:Short-chain dehydrogenase/reductase 3 n=1 Tax=Malurus cyaneus samueli TaxID=2593467 RepID=A0A8C5T8X9_9PASS